MNTEKMREAIIDLLASTRTHSEGVTADLIIALFDRAGGDGEAVAYIDPEDRQLFDEGVITYCVKEPRNQFTHPLLAPAYKTNVEAARVIENLKETIGVLERENQSLVHRVNLAEEFQ